MRRTSLSTIALCLFASGWLAMSIPPVAAQDLGALLPPSQGGVEEVTQPEQVKIEGDVIEAATAQDAVNAAVEQTENELQDKQDGTSSDDQVDPENYGARWLKFGSGWGVISTGMAVYSEQANPTAGLIAQRNAYVIAYTNAKSGMAQMLGEVASEGSTEYERFAELIASADSNGQKSGDVTREQIEQTANKVLKGYITYKWSEEVDEKDQSVHTVYVTIATTPKTMESSQRTGSVRNVAKLQDGLQEAIGEIKNGLVPPVGGRVVTVGDTGQTAFLGFGSAIVSHSTNRAMQLRNRIDAEKIAAVRARDALVGMLSGDQTLWKTGVSSNTTQEFAESTSYAADEASDTATESVDEFRAAFSSDRKIQESITSVRKGQLPAGVQRTSWVSDDKTWAYTVCVYYPDMTALAQKFAKSLDEADLLSGAKDPDDKPATSTSGGSNTTETASAKESTRRVKTRIPALSGGGLNKDDL